MHSFPKNMAHRGAASIAPENTMIAFEKAVEAGCDGIELDVQVSKDGIIMVMHDERLNRTTNGNGFIKDYTVNELKELDAGSSFDKSYGGEPIPTLEEVLQWICQKDKLLNIELKTGLILYPNIEKKVVELVQKYNMVEKVIISSFNHYALVEVKRIAPDIKTGILYMSGLVEPWEYAKKIKADAIHPFFYTIKNADRQQLEELHKSGIMVNPFTIDAEADMIDIIRAGVSGIITNYPQRLQELKRKVLNHEIQF